MDMELKFFTDDESFPFYIGYGGHDDDMFVHSHLDFYELVVVIEGNACHYVNGESYEIKKGDIFVVGSDIEHGYTQPSNFRICNIMFRPESLLTGDYDIKQSSGFHSFFILSPHFGSIQGYRNRMSLEKDDFNRLTDLIDMLVNEFKSDNAGRKTISFAYFMQIVVMLSRAYMKTHTPVKTKEMIGIADAAAYMETNFMNDISSKQLLMISHYSQRHFIRLFTSVYNITPQKYLMSIRMRYACKLLHDKNIRITEVASRCGFSDPNYFSRMFRKYRNLSPKKYRENVT